MVPSGGGEIRVQRAVHVEQQVAVERRCHAQRVVIGRLQHRRGFHPVHPDQQSPARTTSGTQRMRLAQQDQRLGRRKIADAGAGIKHSARRLRGTHQRQPSLRGIGQRELRRKIQPQAQHRQPRVALLQGTQAVAQVIHRNVDRHIGHWLNRRKEPRRLGATARAQVDQHRTWGQRTGDIGDVLRQDRCLGARRVVLSQLGDGVEQARAQRVVKKFGRHPRGRLLQARQQLGARGVRVFLVGLDEMGLGRIRRHGQEGLERQKQAAKAVGAVVQRVAMTAGDAKEEWHSIPTDKLRSILRF